MLFVVVCCLLLFDVCCLLWFVVVCCCLLFFVVVFFARHARAVISGIRHGIRIKGTHLRMPYAVAQVVSVSGLRTRAL